LSYNVRKFIGGHSEKIPTPTIDKEPLFLYGKSYRNSNKGDCKSNGIEKNFVLRLKLVKIELNKKE
ncbi:hypothetical protein QTP99_12105, partial [Caldanaerobacter subterraneus KAk]|uniref:hypothetical protein n=1 Tax=Caldanaerobacter subterraneus TaxID=911092 RepID=UPI0032C1BC11